MAQPEYLCRWAKRGSQVYQTQLPVFVHPKITRSEPTKAGWYTVSVPTGRIDRTKIRWETRMTIFECPATHDGLKACLRKLRPEESSLLDAVDAEIESLRQQLRAKDQLRSALLRVAFSEAHVVPLASILRLIDREGDCPEQSRSGTAARRGATGHTGGADAPPHYERRVDG